MDTELVKIAEENGLEKSQSEIILSKFTTFFEQAKEWELKAKAIVITDASQVKEMKLAREARLALKDIRVGAEKVRKAEKEQYLRIGKAIDGIGNVIKAIIEPLEDYLEKQEKFVETQLAEKKEKVNQERIAALAPFIQDTAIYNLKEMSDEGFAKLLKDSEIAHKAIKEAEKKAEEDRIAKEKAEKEEQERIRAENEKLKEENAKKEAALAKEKAEKDALEKAAKERAEADEKAKQDAIAAEAKAKIDAEAKIEAEKARLASQSDKERLVAFADQLEALELPKVESKEAKALLDWAKRDLGVIILNLKA